MNKYFVLLSATLLAFVLLGQTPNLSIGPQTRAASGTFTPGTPVTFYGAKCDGTSDDTAAFNAAFLALGSKLNTLVIPAATCIINPATVANNLFTGPLSIIGSGPGASIIKVKTGSSVVSNSVLLEWNNAGSGITVSNLTIDLNAATVASGTAGILDFVGSTTAQVTVNQIEIINGGSSGFLYVQAYGVTGGKIINSYFQLTTASTTQNQCINLGSAAANLVNDWLISGNRCVNSGMGFFGADKLTVTQNEIYGWAFGGGITLGPNGTDTTLRKIVVSNNDVHDSGTGLDANSDAPGGIENWFYGAQITGNRIYKTAGAGISNGGGFSNISGNWVGDAGTLTKNAIDQLGTITAGSSYTAGYYTNVALTGGLGTGATANIQVGAGATVVQVSLVNRGANYAVADALSAATANIGGTGSGFSIPVNALIGPPGIISNSNVGGGLNATGSTYAGNHIYEDGGGTTAYGISDATNGLVTSYIGDNDVQGVGIAPYYIFGVVNYLTTRTRDNRIINPCFDIDNRNEGGTVTANAAYTADRWKISASSTVVNYVRTATSGATPLLRCRNEMKMTVNSGGTAPAGASFYGIFQDIEAGGVFDLGYADGTPLPLTLDFCARASVGGTYSWAIKNINATYSFVDQYNLPASATVKCFSFLIPGSSQSLGTTVTNAGLELHFDTGAGTTEQTATLRSWVSGAFVAATNSTQLIAAATNATLEITAVRLYQSAYPRAWSQRPIGEEYALTNRYYRKTFPIGTAPATAAGVGGALCVENPIALGEPSILWETPNMRVSSAPTTYNPVSANATWRDVVGNADIAVTVDPGTAVSADRVEIATSGTVTSLGSTVCIHATRNADY